MIEWFSFIVSLLVVAQFINQCVRMNRGIHFLQRIGAIEQETTAIRKQLDAIAKRDQPVIGNNTLQNKLNGYGS